MQGLFKGDSDLVVFERITSCLWIDGMSRCGLGRRGGARVCCHSGCVSSRCSGEVRIAS